MTSSIIPHVYDFVVRCDKKGCSTEAWKSIRAVTYKERKQAEARPALHYATDRKGVRMTPNLATVEWLHSTTWWIKHPSRPCTDKKVRRLIQEARINALDLTLDNE